MAWVLGALAEGGAGLWFPLELGLLVRAVGWLTPFPPFLSSESLPGSRMQLVPASAVPLLPLPPTLPPDCSLGALLWVWGSGPGGSVWQDCVCGGGSPRPEEGPCDACAGWRPHLCALAAPGVRGSMVQAWQVHVPACATRRGFVWGRALARGSPAAEARWRGGASRSSGEAGPRPAAARRWAGHRGAGCWARPGHPRAPVAHPKSSEPDPGSAGRVGAKA